MSTARASRFAASIGVLVAALVAAPAPAGAHPLGNFSINRLDRVTISNDRIEVLYILDQAEVPTFQERGLSGRAILALKRREVESRLRLSVEGRPVALRLAGEARLSFPPGQGDLPTTRVELPLIAEVEGARRVALRDDTFPGRVGWRAIVARPGEGTTVRAGLPASDPTRGLRSYPSDRLQAPLEQRSAGFAVQPGSGTVIAPTAAGDRLVTTANAGADDFSRVFHRAMSGEGVLVLLLVAAFGWGAFHALSPGHGKAMMAAYLVGTRGTARHAIALGATVTITHTVGVFALGLVTLLLAQYVLPERLYPWLSLVSGLLVVAVGASLLRSRLRWARAGGAPRAGRSHSHADAQAHSHSHSHSHDHGPHHHGHLQPGWKGLVGIGASAGLIPCPSALVVLLSALSQQRVGLGLLMIVVFSAGLAATLTLLGLAVVYGRTLTSRLSFSGRAAATLPALSTLLILAVGVVLTARAVPAIV